MSKKLNIQFVPITTFFSIIISIVGFIGIDKLSKLVQAHPTPTVIITYICIVSIGILIGFLIDLLRTKKKQDNSINYDQVLEKHSILIFDDQEMCLRDIKRVTSGSQYDVVMVKDISDYRLVENFDIIIGDICNVGNFEAKNSIPVLRAIKENYPYKIVIAMSKSPVPNWETFSDCFISKEDRDKYPNDILNTIQSSITRLSKASYWTEVEGELSKKGTPAENIKKYKDQYYTHINKRNNIS